MRYGAIEAGGTKFVCAIGDDTLNIIERKTFTTETPEKTMPKVIDFFKRVDDIRAIGIGSFGPIDLTKDSTTYGYITSTPKQAWKQFNFVGTLKKHLNKIPIAWTTDVNVAGYGEYVAGHGIGCTNILYYTIGTGIGGGAVLDGQFVEGISHPEMGHMLIRRHTDDPFYGNCPYHKDCLEGMASGPAIEQRSGIAGQNLVANDPSWDMIAYYIAQCVYNATLFFSPQRIILGGGVMKQPFLLKKVHNEFANLMNHYLPYPEISSYIVTPKLEDNAGIIGCLAFARDSLANNTLDS